jgi:uncharacterized protein
LSRQEGGRVHGRLPVDPAKRDRARALDRRSHRGRAPRRAHHRARKRRLREKRREALLFLQQSLFTAARAFAASRGIADIAYGFTADDAGDYRPGQQAAAEQGIRRPLFDAGLGKAEIRAIAKLLGLEIWNKPAAPCLASRIPYGSEVTETKLSHVEQVEALLHELGFRVCRARYDGTTMRIELERDDIARAAMPQVRQRLLELAAILAIPLLTLDLEGFKSGKLNREIGR